MPLKIQRCHRPYSSMKVQVDKFGKKYQSVDLPPPLRFVSTGASMVCPLCRTSRPFPHVYVNEKLQARSGAFIYPCDLILTAVASNLEFSSVRISRPNLGHFLTHEPCIDQCVSVYLDISFKRKALQREKSGLTLWSKNNRKRLGFSFKRLPGSLNSHPAVCKCHTVL